MNRDLRYSKGPIASLTSHCNRVNAVSWSPIHAELLVSRPKFRSLTFFRQVLPATDP
jgi:hypothetical protein